MMQGELYSPCYGHHFTIPCDLGLYSDVPAGTSAAHHAKQHKDNKKAQDMPLTMQILIHNLLIDVILDN